MMSAKLLTSMALSLAVAICPFAAFGQGDEPGQPAGDPKKAGGAAEDAAAAEDDDKDPELSDAERENELIRTQLKMAELYEAKNDMESAMKALLEVRKVHPKNLHIAAKVGRLAFETNKYDLLLEVAPTLVMRYPNKARYRLWVVTALVAKGRPAEALNDLRWLQQKKPNDPELRKDLAAAYEKMKQPARALTHYDWLIARQPRNVEYRLARAALLGDLKREKEQRKELQAILRLAPKNVGVRLELADFAYYSDKFSEAESHANAVLTVEPKNMKALALIAKIKKGRDMAKRRGVFEYRMEERYGDFQNDLQERSEDF